MKFTESYHPTHAKTSWVAAATAPSRTSAVGINWGTFNLGAIAAGTAEANYGWYFRWGDIIPQRGTTGAPTGYGEHDDYYDKTIACEALYAKIVNLTEDYAIYDMAKAFLGPDWRLPTKAELQSLLDAGKSFDESSALIGNITQGDPDYYVTFPAAGFWKDGSWGRGERVLSNYWASTSHEDAQYAYRVIFNADSGNAFANAGTTRYQGLSVRPVQD